MRDASTASMWRTLLLLATLTTACSALAFSPHVQLRPQLVPRRAAAATALLDMGAVDPQALMHAHTAASSATSQLLADVAAVAEEAKDPGWWESYIGLVKSGILSLRGKYAELGAAYPYGFSIFTFVLGVKLITLPLNWNQLSSTATMKSIKPQQDRVQLWYGDNAEMKNAMVGNLYAELDINPLAGCLPALAQIPIFLGVYYSVTEIAKEAQIQEGFFWIPNLSGPISDRRDGVTWLVDGWVNGVPRLGWEDTLAYLSLPVILVCTQTAALYLLGSFDALNEDDPNTKNVAVALKLLPFMIGWFAMNAPSGLGLYWVFNNVLTTLSTVTVKKLVEKPELDPTVDLIALGPRREPLPMAQTALPSWVPEGPPPEADGEEEAAAEGAASEAEA